MKKSKGFTLIELLAVILILGIIALIAIPTVNNVIKQSRQGAWAATGNGIIKAVDQDVQLCELNTEGAGVTNAVCPDNANYIGEQIIVGPDTDGSLALAKAKANYAKISVKGDMPAFEDVAILKVVGGVSYVAYTANKGTIKCSNYITGDNYGTPTTPANGTATFAVKCNYK